MIWMFSRVWLLFIYLRSLNRIDRRSFSARLIVPCTILQQVIGWIAREFPPNGYAPINYNQFAHISEHCVGLVRIERLSKQVIIYKVNC